MKRIIISSLIAMVAIAVQARDFSYEGVTYTVIDENARTCMTSKGYYRSYENTFYPGAISASYSGALTLPSNPIDNSGEWFTLVSIGEMAFAGSSKLTSVTIPNSVTEIGSGAFRECSGLTSVTIPNSVTEIGGSAFMACRSLSSVSISNRVTSLEYRVFNGCESLTSVTIPNSVTSIGNDVFIGCRSLSSVTIPNSVTSIGNYAFECTGLTSVTIPNSVTSIGQYAFKDCTSLTKADFASIESLCKIKFVGAAGGNPLYYAHNLYINGKEIKDLVIPSSVTSIGWQTFQAVAV